MIKKVLFSVYIILVISGVSYRWYKFLVGSEIKQPIEFNHETHVDIADCNTCHKYVKKLAFAGIPTLKDCMECHEDEPETDSPEEKKLFNYIDNEEEIKWLSLYKTPVHVYFSHRRHIAIGKLECEKCHGNIGLSTRPPAKALVNLDMDGCINCHKESNAGTDCVNCHK